MNIFKILMLSSGLLLSAEAAIAGETFCEISDGEAIGYYCSDSVEVVVGADGTIEQLDDRGRVVERDSRMISFSLSRGCKAVMEERVDRDAKFCRFSLVDD